MPSPDPAVAHRAGPRLRAVAARFAGAGPACLLVLGLLAGCGPSQPSVLVVPVRPAASAPAGAPSQAGASTAVGYAHELATLQQAIDAAMRQVAAQPDDLALAQETVSMLLERARLGGRLEDYAAAQALLDARTARARNTADMCQARASLHFALHRLDAADAALAQCGGMMNPAEAQALSGDIALYRGRYAAAEGRYRELLNQTGTSSSYIRMALYRSMTGAPAEASALLEAAEKRYHGSTASTRAWIRLQRGLVALDQGRLEEALALYRLAADALPGWWLIDEHVAEIGRLRGDTAGARVLLEQLIAQHGQPEHMDELALLLRDAGQVDAAAPWIERARSIYRQRLRSFPEAAAGHAVEHFLQFGPTGDALALARRNAELRPYGDAQITLAAALFRAGRAGEAAQWIRRVLASGWDTPRLHVVAAQVHAEQGQHALADAHAARALAMNPYARHLYAVPAPPPARPTTP